MKQIVEIENTAGGLPLTHTFSDGVYAREIFMPKGMIVVGHIHKARHLNIVSTGKAKVWYNGSVKEITAPYTFESEANMRKVLYIEEDMFWTTIHITNETDVLKLEETLVDKNASNKEELDKMINKVKPLLLGE